jgi:hypothetical protein
MDDIYNDSGWLARETSAYARVVTRAALRKSSADYVLEKSATARFLGQAFKSRAGEGVIRMQHSDGSADLMTDQGRVFVIPQAAGALAWELKPGQRISFLADADADVVVEIVAKL